MLLRNGFQRIHEELILLAVEMMFGQFPEYSELGFPAMIAHGKLDEFPQDQIKQMMLLLRLENTVLAIAVGSQSGEDNLLLCSQMIEKRNAEPLEKPLPDFQTAG